MAVRYVDDLFAGLGKTMGIEGLCLDEGNGCVLSFDEAVIVNFQYLPEADRLVFFSTIGEVPEECRTHVFEAMLEANFVEAVTIGNSLYYQSEDGSAGVVHRLSVAALEQKDFENRLEAFVATVEDWQARLRSFSADVEGAIDGGLGTRPAPDIIA